MKTKCELELECNQEAIELYISYQLFRFDAKWSIKFSRFAVAKNLTHIPLALIPAVAFHKDASALDQKFFHGNYHD